MNVHWISVSTRYLGLEQIHAISDSVRKRLRPVYEAVEVSVEAVDAVDAVEVDGGGLEDPQGPRDGRHVLGEVEM